MSIRVTDNSRVNDLLHTINELNKRKIQIGIFGNSGSKILMIATVNEFGCDIQVTDKMRSYLHSQGLHLKKDTSEIHIPERAFIRGGFDENKGKINRMVKDLLKKLFDFEITLEQFWNKIGTHVVGMVKEYMTSLRQPSNHTYTIQKKGSSNPLIDTGELREKITYKVV